MHTQSNETPALRSIRGGYRPPRGYDIDRQLVILIVVV